LQIPSWRAHEAGFSLSRKNTGDGCGRRQITDESSRAGKTRRTIDPAFQVQKSCKKKQQAVRVNSSWRRYSGARMGAFHAPSVPVSLDDSPAMSHAHAGKALRVFLQILSACAESCFPGCVR
jgi:hypothetical protein